MATTRSSGANSATIPQRRWFGRNWKWFVPLSLVLVLVLGGGTGFYLTFRTQIELRFSTAYADTLSAVQKAKKVTDVLGEPITAVRWLPGGDLSDGRANVSFDVQGPKGTAEVKSAASCLDGKWGLATLVVTVHDGPTIKLTDDINLNGNGPPRFHAQPGSNDKNKKPDATDAPPGLDFNLNVPGDEKPDEKK